MENPGPQKQSAILLISCPDQKGIVAAITKFLYDNAGNIIRLDQHVNMQENIFLSRVEWDLQGFAIPREQIAASLSELMQKFNSKYELHFSDFVPQVAIFVSKLTHCLYDVLSRYREGEWNISIPLVISNHPDADSIVKKFGINYFVFEINDDNKQEQERKQLELLKAHDINFIVLTRYMQILSPEFIAHYPNKIINIHHSFLPAFPGAKPYHSAYDRGVKIIGATSHYVTSDLDGGPIIDQDIVRVSHQHSITDFIRKGRDLEKIVLARAIWYHLQHKVLVYKNKTVVFD
ncbi:MAG TPA: formyltetrahydrofolate deformylase [bacterium]|mgnify:CR=1 FL=1|nr:formyltetrahydrofolate deformylase [bacterium]HPN44109.1 formyltetrahydrofolate deformylase [bacterium]